VAGQYPLLFEASLPVFFYWPYKEKFVKPSLTLW
jgi:hypothetical protein